MVEAGTGEGEKKPTFPGIASTAGASLAICVALTRRPRWLSARSFYLTSTMTRASTGTIDAEIAGSEASLTREMQMLGITRKKVMRQNERTDLHKIMHFYAELRVERISTESFEGGPPARG
mmetsp:Transcript_5641/g.8958  ORF Transcript_5641/g.8958 Transcript_5641/m.8958 type:complete len:121 (+) Transcript_5641:234-596(+)